MPLSETGMQFREEALRLKAAQPALMRATRRNIRVAAQPAVVAIRQSAIATLPRRGGLNQWVADAPVRISILTGARTAGVTLRDRKPGHALVPIDAGRVRHRVFGTWRTGVPTQQVPPGFASKPIEALSPAIEAACLAAMSEAAHIAGFR